MLWQILQFEVGLGCLKSNCTANDYAGLFKDRVQLRKIVLGLADCIVGGCAGLCYS